MAKTPILKMAWLACAAIAMLSALPAQAAGQAAEAGKALQAGEYITDKGWGRLLIKEKGGALTFSLESTSGEDMCALDGAIDASQGVAKGSSGDPDCKVKFASTPQGIDVSAATPKECKAFCGYNGDFEALYLRVKKGCSRDEVDRTRTAFKRLYDGKNYQAALTTLSPVVSNCLPTLEWEDEGAIRNDLAITQYKNGLYAQCLSTLDKYAVDAGKDDDAVVDGWTPALADRYLSIVRAARTNISLCRTGAARK